MNEVEIEKSLGSVIDQNMKLNEQAYSVMQEIDQKCKDRNWVMT